MRATKLRVSFAGTHDPGFTRTELLAEGLLALGIPAESCVESAWGSTSERIAAARRGLANPRLAFMLLRSYSRLVRRLRCGSTAPDLLLLAHPGQLDALVLRTVMTRTPMVLDAFISIDETLADREIGARHGWSRRFARAVDRAAFRVADRVIVDTAAHGRRFAREYGLDPARAVVVPVGAADPFATNAESTLAQEETRGPTLRVLYFGGFIPLHGVPVILEAARRLGPAAGISFDLVGDGQEWEAADRFCRSHPMGHVRLIRRWMPESELIDRHVKTADVCLGVFADRPKTRDVVPAKVYVALACGRPVLTGDTPAIREEVMSRATELPLLTSRLGDPDDLAQRLVQLRENPDLRARLSRGAREVYEAHFRPERVVEPLVPILHELAARASARR